MLLPTLLLAVATAAPLELDVTVVREVGHTASLRLRELDPGVERTVEAPCGRAPVCRIVATVMPVGASWRVSVKVTEVRRGLFGERDVTVANPTFLVPTGVTAEMFSGREIGFGGDQRDVAQVGLHVQVRVTEAR